MWQRLADKIIKQLAKTKVTLINHAKVKGDGNVIVTQTQEYDVWAAVSSYDDVKDVTKIEDREIQIVFSKLGLPWEPTAHGTSVRLNNKELEVLEVKHSGYIKNEPICYILRCQYE